MDQRDIEKFLVLVMQKHALSNEMIRKMTPQEIMALGGTEDLEFTIEELQEYLTSKPDKAIRLLDSELTAVGGGFFDPELEIYQTIYYVYCFQCGRTIGESRIPQDMEQLKTEHENAFPGHWASVEHRKG